MFTLNSCHRVLPIVKIFTWNFSIFSQLLVENFPSGKWFSCTAKIENTLIDYIFGILLAHVYLYAVIKFAFPLYTFPLNKLNICV